MTSYPAGVCIQELAARIQKDENRVPAATVSAAISCAHCGTRLGPNSRTPRKLASKKNAVSTSGGRNGPITFAVASENRLQLVPNWTGITLSDTTPLPGQV